VNPLDRYFHAEHGACRSYLFSKAFLLLLALDTWMLMLGHAGRYGVAGFNVAHFAWLDALLPLPTADFYVGVLLLTGLLALVTMLTGIRKSTGLALFALYTLSWSMSMLDSYQHHYLVSLILLCLAFFPVTSAAELHPLARVVPEELPHKAKKLREREQAAAEERNGYVYAAVVLGACGLYALVDSSGHTWAAFFLLAGSLAVATFVYRPVRRAPLLRSGFGFNLLGASVSVVYLYTAIAKIDPNWLDGHTIRRITSVEQVFAGLAELGASFGIEHDRFWALFATFVIPQELFMGCAYLVAVHQDRLRGRWPRVVCMLAFMLAIALHVGAEAMGLEIGWFSYYMLMLAVCFLLPLVVVDRLVTVLTWPARALHRQALQWEAESKPQLGGNLVLALGGAGVLGLVGKMIDLPGAVSACLLAGAALVAVTLALSVLPATAAARRADPRRHVIATVMAATMMWLAIAASPVRWEFYRYLGGDLARREDLEGALQAYRRGERYAPAGESRRDRIKEIERELGR